MTAITPETKAKLIAVSESNIRLAWTSLSIIPQIRDQLGRTPLRAHVPVLSFQEFVLLSQADISALINDMATHLPGGRGMLYSRLTLLTCYETLRTLKGSQLSIRLMKSMVCSRACIAVPHGCFVQ